MRSDILYVLSQPVPPSMPPEVRVRYFQRTDAEAFRRLNEHWISKYFTLEEPDRIMLSDPLGKIISPGGAIFVATAGDVVIGTCALMPEHDAIFELVKMAVAEDWQGRGVGRKLLLFALQEATELGVKRLRLETNSNLKSAIHLYEAVGFRHVSAHASPFVRADVFMEMDM